MTAPTGTDVERRVRWMAAGTIPAVAAFLLLVTVQPGGPLTTRNLDDLAQAAAPLLVALPACWWAAARATGRLRRAWVFFALFAASWGIGQVVWCYLEIVRHHPESGSSWADVGYLLALPFAAAAIASYPGPRLHWAGRFRTLVDGLLVVTTLLFVSWTIAVDAGGLTRSRETVLQQVTLLIFPSADIILLAMLLAVIVRGTRKWRDPLLVIVASIFLLFLGDSSSIYVGLSSGYQTGNVVDVFWFASFLLLAVAAVMPVPALPDIVRSEGQEPRWIEFIPYIPLALALLMGVVQLSRGNGFGAGEEWLVLATAVLLVVRQYLFVVENRALTSRLQEMVGDLEWLALHDPLTGLANRTLFNDRLSQSLAEQRRDHRNISVVYLDLDDFKAVNDRFGHATGDELLRAVAGRLSGEVRDGDTLARLGGDEFAILMPSSGGPATTEAILERLLAELDEPFRVHDYRLAMRASVGFASSEGGTSAKVLIQNADDAMYTAKAEGKHRVCAYDRAMHRTRAHGPPASPKVPERLG